jgi:hypothetical protein
MLKVARYALLTLALYVVALAGPAWAWSITNMFSSGNSTSNTKNIKPAKKANSNRRTASKPGVVDTLTGAPKKLYTNTKAMVTPSKKTTPPARQRSDAWKGYNPPSTSSQKPSGIKNWFTPEPTPLPRTVGEFMKQKRVEP